MDEKLERIRIGSKQEMQQGIALLGQGEWRAALAHFDRAVMLRETTPWRDDPDAAWGLAAAWINRSDALRRLEDVHLLPEAIRSLDRAIDAMGFVPLAENPVFVERLILAWLNRATACGESGELDQALADFASAEVVFSKCGTDTTPNRRFMHSMLHVNRARVLLEGGRLEDSWRDARLGLAVLRKLEPGDELVAQAGIRARSLWCRVLAVLVDQPEAVAVEDWIAEATDTVEEALLIVKRSGLMEPAASDLVRYGAKIYRACQPQFLAGFIREAVGEGGPLAGDLVLLGEMRAEIELARQESGQRLLMAPHDDAVARREMRIIRALAE